MRFFNNEYIFAAAHSRQYHCLQKPVRQRRPHKDNCAGNRGDVRKQYCGGGLLQGHGQEAERMKIAIVKFIKDLFAYFFEKGIKNAKSGKIIAIN